MPTESAVSMSRPLLFASEKCKLEDLKVLRHSPDLFNNVNIGQGQLLLIINIFCSTIYGVACKFWSSDLKKF